MTDTNPNPDSSTAEPFDPEALARRVRAVETATGEVVEVFTSTAYPREKASGSPALDTPTRVDDVRRFLGHPGLDGLQAAADRLDLALAEVADAEAAYVTTQEEHEADRRAWKDRSLAAARAKRSGARSVPKPGPAPTRDDLAISLEVAAERIDVAVADAADATRAWEASLAEHADRLAAVADAALPLEVEEVRRLVAETSARFALVRDLAGLRGIALAGLAHLYAHRPGGGLEHLDNASPILRSAALGAWQMVEASGSTARPLREAEVSAGLDLVASEVERAASWRPRLDPALAAWIDAQHAPEPEPVEPDLSDDPVEAAYRSEVTA